MTAVAHPAEEIRTSPRLLWIVFIAATALYAIPAIWLLRNYLQPAFDLAIYDQTLWLIQNGDSFNTITAAHIFGGHFSPILILVAPLSLIPGGPVPELVLQSVLLASGVFPAARLARHFGKSTNWFVAAYVLHPAIIGGSWYGFRPWNIAVPVFLWAIYWIVRSPTPGPMIVSGIGLLMFREDLAAWVGLSLIVLALAEKIRWRALIVPGAVLGGASALVLLSVLPSFSPVDTYIFATSAQTTLPSPVTGLASVAARALFLLIPLAVVPSKIDWKLMAPLSLPVLGLLIKGGNALTTFFHYDMMFVPVLLMVIGLSPRAEPNPRHVTVFSLVALLLFGVLRPFPPQHGPNPFLQNGNVTAQLDRVMDHVRALEGYEALSVSAPSRLIPHLSGRNNVFIYPRPIITPVQGDDENEEALEYDCPEPNIVVSDGSGLEAWNSLLASSYELVGREGPLSVWRHSVEMPDEPCTAAWQRPR